MTTPTPNDINAVKNRLGIVGNSPQLVEAVTRAMQVAPIDLSVLIIGESGSGKEFFPKIIHNGSPRKHAKFIAVNCGAIPEGTIDSELFGHEKGAFTDAISSRKGYFEEASGGTLFLDEVAELPLTTQARLLRVLESGEYIRVGSSTVRRTDIRIVAATNVDLTKAVAEGRFREDLYYRLSTILITVPPLRDRGTDIILLARKFAADFAERYRTPSVTFNDSARELLMTYRWPGNVRQLKNVMEQAALFEAGTELTGDTIRRYIPRDAVNYTPALTGSATSGPQSYEREREILFNMIFRLRRELDTLREEIAAAPMRAEKATSVDFVEEMPLPPHSIVRFNPTSETTILPKATGQAEPEPCTLEDNEREIIRRSLERNSGRRKATAEELNISERTLYRKIKEYGLE